MKVKVNKELPQFNLHIGDELIYNEDYDTYDYIEYNEDVSDYYNVTSDKTISLSSDIVDNLYRDSFTDENDIKILEIDNEFRYIKPIAIKVFNVIKEGEIEFEGQVFNLTVGDKVIKGLDGSMIPVTNKVFNKLFKVI